MIIIGCDLHTRFQQIAMLDSETGEIVERRVEHANGEAQQFYAALPGAARVGIEATGYARWFERLLAEQGHELWIGDASAIRAARVRQQKTDAPRELAGALAAGGGGADGRAQGPRIAARVSAVGPPPRHAGMAKVAVARKLAVRLYGQLRQAGAQPQPPTRMQGSSCSPVVGTTRPTP